MKPSKQGLPALLLLAAIGFTSNVSAALFSRTIGTDEMVYDSALDITWLKNANTNGLMNWDAAQAWADNLVYGGYDDWRLPTSLNGDGSGSCFGLNCTGSEMGHLFYGDINNGLGGRAGYSITTMHNANFDLFSNLQSYVYWLGTAYSEYNVGGSVTGMRWLFATIDGNQYWGGKQDAMYAFAVRTGDVAAVPLPAAIWLFGSSLAGLAALGGRIRRCG